MEYKKLGDVASYINGYAFKPSDWETNGLPIIRIQNLTGSSNVVNYYTGKYPKDIEINEGDVLISWSASLGVYIWKRGRALLNQHIFKVKFDKGDIDKHYFVHAIEYAIKKMEKKMHGATMKHIVKKDFESILIPISDMEKQVFISNKLEKITQNLKNLERQSDLLDQLIKARFVEMFGDPVINSKGWKSAVLGNLCSKISSGNTPKGGSEVYVDEGIMFFRSQNVWKGHLELDDIAYIDKKTHESMKETKLKYGDILITKTGRINTENSSLGRSALYLGKDDAANINGHVYLVRLNSNEVNRRFILEILISHEFRDLIRRVCVGGIDKRQLNRNHIEDFPIILPPIELQNQFASFVQQVDKSKFVGIEI